MSRRAGATRRSVIAASTLLLAATIQLGFSAPASAEVYYAENGNVQFSGRGYGHARGMSQWGAYGAAVKGLSAAQILDFYYPGTTPASYGDPVLRVQLRGDDGVDLVVAQVPRNGSLGVIDTGSSPRDMPLPATVGGSPVTAWRAVAVGNSRTALQGQWDGGWRDYPAAGPWVTDGGFEFVSSTSVVALVYPDGSQRDYRGALRSLPSGPAGLTTLSIVPMESYLRSVVPSESPSSWPAAALQAQAVAARSYTASVRTANGAYDICDTTACQVYSGVAAYDAAGRLTRRFEAASTDGAVAATAGSIRTYSGSPAFTQFSASNGGWSVDGGKPYLVAREDPYDGVVPNSASSWTATISADSIGSRFGVGQLTRLIVNSRDGRGTWGGRVLSVTVVGSTGSATVSGEAFRTRLGMKSTWWTASAGAPPGTYPPPDVSGVLLRGGASGKLELHSVGRSSTYTQFTQHVATAFGEQDPADWRFFIGSYGGSGRQDLIGVKLRNTASGRVEVHVASAASGYQAFSAHIATAMPAIPATGVQVQVGSYRNDGRSNLFIIPTASTGTGSVEVHVLSEASNYQTWALHTGTALSTAGITDANWRFLISDAAGNGDLLAVVQGGSTGSGRSELHVLSQASGYRTWVQHSATAMALTSDASTTWAARDFNGDGKTDLFVMLSTATGSGRSEVHVLDGASGLTTWSAHIATPLPSTPPPWQMVAG